MLLHEFAMIPDVFNASALRKDRRLELIVVQILRGLSDNGLLANLYKDHWEKEVRDRILNFPQELQEVRDKLIACLKVLKDRNRLVRHPRAGEQAPSQGADWLKLAMRSHEETPFHGIILDKELAESCGLTDDALMEISRALDSSQWRTRRRSMTLKKHEADYRKQLTPILRHARTLALVDPYFNTRGPCFLKTIQLCSALMGQRPSLERRPGRIHIHTDQRQPRETVHSPQEDLGWWENELRELNHKHGHRFKVFLWTSSSETLHDRFILTDQCGISIPGGLDCRPSSKANDTVWSLLDEEDRRVWLQKFDPDARANPYEYVDSREVVDTQ